MPSIEFMAEIDALKARCAESEDRFNRLSSVYATYAEAYTQLESRCIRADHMAGLWKRCAGQMRYERDMVCNGAVDSAWTITNAATSRAEKAEAERDALKCCGNCAEWYWSEADESFLCKLKVVTDNANCDTDRYYVCPEWKAREK